MVHNAAEMGTIPGISTQCSGDTGFSPAPIHSPTMTTTGENTTTTHGACVFCNTTRPTEQVLCPACGRGWIDAAAVDAVQSVAKAEAAAIRTITTDPAPSVRRSTYRARWWVPVVVAAVVFAGYWGVVTLVDDTTATPAASPAPPTTLATTTTAPVETPPTTLPPASPTTTIAPTTTTTSSTTTTLPLLPVGQTMDLDDLRLGVVELGDFAFGTASDDVLPDLVATFGQPTDIQDVTPAWGVCGTDTGSVYTFGGLHVITTDREGTEVLAGFVVEATGSPSDALQSFSGIGVGATVAELDATYRSVDLTIDESITTWIVRSTNDGRTLLWGTAAGATDEATIDVIASPRPCDGGPAATG